MTKIQRIAGVIIGVYMLLMALSLILQPKKAPPVIVFLMCIALFVYSLQTLWYYFTMARFMVGGRTVLYKGVIALDFSILTLTMSSIPQRYIMLYLLGVLIFTGAVDVMRGLELKKEAAPGWARTLVPGVIYILVGLVGSFFLDNFYVMTYIFSGGLIYLGLVRITSAVRRSAIVYIQ